MESSRHQHPSRAAAVTFLAVDPRSERATRALDHYFSELNERFDTGFNVHTGGGDKDAAAMIEPHGVFLVMVDDGEVIGCGGVQRVDDTTGEVKRMWIDRDWRGLGLGTRLLSRLEEETLRLGYNRVVLDTNSSLKEAIALYTGAGYHEIERYNTNPYAQHWFEKNLG